MHLIRDPSSAAALNHGLTPPHPMAMTTVSSEPQHCGAATSGHHHHGSSAQRQEQERQRQGAQGNTNPTPPCAPRRPQALTLAPLNLPPPMYPPGCLRRVPGSPYGLPPDPTQLTVQDRIPTSASGVPVFNGINPSYPGLRVLRSDPPVFAVEGFLTSEECSTLIDAASGSFGAAPVVGRGEGKVTPERTSAACYLAREDLPWYISKISALTGKPPSHCELPQVGRYLPTQQYRHHHDAFDLSTEDGMRFALNGGQRSVTVLVYLNDVERGGGRPSPYWD